MLDEPSRLNLLLLLPQLPSSKRRRLYLRLSISYMNSIHTDIKFISLNNRMESLGSSSGSNSPADVENKERERQRLREQERRRREAVSE